MIFTQYDDVSIAITSFFMKIIGFWLANNQNEQVRRKAALSCTVFSLMFSMWIQTTDIYHSRDDFEGCLYDACNIASLVMPLVKISVLHMHREKFFRLILFMKRKFLHADYDDYEASVLGNCKRKCTFFICFFIFLTEATIFSYIVMPIYLNIGKNESERILPFKMWVNLPLSTTPYFEIAFTAQVVCTYYVGLCYFCFDNFLCIINLHLAGQFRILRYRFSSKHFVNDQGMQDEKSGKNSSEFEGDWYAIFKSYVRQHQMLITYCKQHAEVFNVIILTQVTTFSLLICLDGYQILLASTTYRRIIFVFHVTACITQLLMFSYSCDCIIRESTNLGPEIISGPWLHLPTNKNTRRLKKDMVLVIMRSNLPCCLTGCGFFIVSLETYTKVLSTAASYFTLLQQTQDSLDS